MTHEELKACIDDQDRRLAEALQALSDMRGSVPEELVVHVAREFERIADLSPQIFSNNLSTHLGPAGLIGATKMPSSIDIVNPSQGTYASDFKYVSVDELTDFCSLQLQACDTKIRNLTSNQQSISTNAEQLAKAQKALDDLATSVGAGSNGKLDKDSNATDCQQDADAFKKLQDTISNLQDLANGASDPTVKAAIEAKITALNGYIDASDPKNPKMAKDMIPQDVTDMDKDLQPIADQLSTDQSMNMMKVQSAVGQREQMVQLVTGMIQKFDEMTSSVVANIGK